MNTFYRKLHKAWERNQSLVCLGLDPDLDKLPRCLLAEEDPVFAFNKALIDATSDLVCAYKPQFAHYAGQDCLDSLRKTFAYLRERHPEIVTILDAKRGDIGSTADYYAKEAFEIYRADAVTVNPYMGGDTLLPFTKFPAHGVIVLCRTSNPGSGELQSLEGEGIPLYEIVAQKAAADWNQNNNLALVIGATYPEELRRVRSLVGTMPLLVPGIGAQGGDAAAVLDAGLNADGTGLIINSSRGLMYAGSDENFAMATREATLALREELNTLRKQCRKGNL